METIDSFDQPQRGLKWVLRAFRSRNYRLYFIGQGISLIGTWMQQIALIWLVYRLTRSAFMLGVVGFASQIPMMVLTPIAGVLADRWNRYRIMIVNQVLEMVLALILAVMIFTNRLSIWPIVAVGLILGAINALDAPTRHAFVIQLVDRRQDLANAIALNSAMFNGARLIGPSIAGVLISLTGEGICFLLNAVSFLAVIAALRAMKIKPQKKSAADKGHIGRELIEGFEYTFHHKEIRLIILYYAWVALLGMSVTVLMPILADKILKGGAHGLGFLMGAMGIGAMIGAFGLAARPSVRGLGKLIGLSATVFGLALVLLSASRSFAVSLGLMVFIGLGMVSQMTASNTFLQTVVDDDKRARVMAFYLLAFFGTVPLGNLLAGSVASKLGVPSTILLSGLAVLAGSIFFTVKFTALAKEVKRSSPD